MKLKILKKLIKVRAVIWASIRPKSIALIPSNNATPELDPDFNKF